MTDKDDANGRLEYNLGAAGSKAAVHISNVSVVMHQTLLYMLHLSSLEYLAVQAVHYNLQYLLLLC